MLGKLKFKLNRWSLIHFMATAAGWYIFTFRFVLGLSATLSGFNYRFLSLLYQRYVFRKKNYAQMLGRSNGKSQKHFSLHKIPLVTLGYVLLQQYFYFRLIPRKLSLIVKLWKDFYLAFKIWENVRTFFFVILRKNYAN